MVFGVSRSKHWEVLEWLLFLNIRDEVTYKLVHGDKDTFRAAFSLAGRADEFQLVCGQHARHARPSKHPGHRYHTSIPLPVGIFSCRPCCHRGALPGACRRNGMVPFCPWRRWVWRVLQCEELVCDAYVPAGPPGPCIYS